MGVHCGPTHGDRVGSGLACSYVAFYVMAQTLIMFTFGERLLVDAQQAVQWLHAAERSDRSRPLLSPPPPRASRLVSHDALIHTQ